MTSPKLPAPKVPASMSEEAARRLAVRHGERERRHAEALRANLQRRKAQARERGPEASPAVDAPTPDQQKDFLDGINRKARES